MHIRIVRARWFPLLAVACAGCASPPKEPELDRLRQRASEALNHGVRYEALATVRAQSIEALQQSGVGDVCPRIRQALTDPHPGVRFAACLALGRLGDKVAIPSMERLLESELASDRIAAIFALHLNGDQSHTYELAGYLLDAADPVTRRHAAMVLGRMDESGAVKLLARAMKDPDAGVRANALESLALLGAPQARKTLYSDAFSGSGAEETFALTALAEVQDPQYAKLFREKLDNGIHIETRLAAARGLGKLGDNAGSDLAIGALRYEPEGDAQNDPAENQRVRVRQLAALALADIGNWRALPELEKMMNAADDPRLQVAAAKAILDIVQRLEKPKSPFGDDGNRPGRAP